MEEEDREEESLKDEDTGNTEGNRRKDGIKEEDENFGLKKGEEKRWIRERRVERIGRRWRRRE